MASGKVVGKYVIFFRCATKACNMISQKECGNTDFTEYFHDVRGQHFNGPAVTIKPHFPGVQQKFKISL